MLGKRHRRWTGIKTASGYRLVLAGDPSSPDNIQILPF